MIHVVRASHKRIILLLAIMIFVVIAPAHAQEPGAVIEGNPWGATSSGSLNPIFCDNDYCRRITDLLFPYLLAVDPETGIYGSATGNDMALVSDWNAPDADGRVLFELRSDLTWSDGTPITADDVAFTFRVIASDEVNDVYNTSGIESMEALDSHTLAVTYTKPGCDALDLTQMPILPAHILDRGGDHYAYLNNHLFNTKPTVTAGDFSLRTVQATDFIRLDADVPGISGFEFRDVGGTVDMLDAFLNGETNLLINPPYNRYADVYARVPSGEIQVAEYPGLLWDSIVYNLADPNDPRPAFDEDGDPVEQRPHPILSDLAVRQAIQLALDVPALIEASTENHATQMASSIIPASWAFDESLLPIAHNLDAARELLENAGWRDTNGDSIRECIECSTARRGESLYLQMSYLDSARRNTMASLIRQQLLRAGINIDAYSIDYNSLLNSLESQQFTMALVGWQENFPVDPHQSSFTIDEDFSGGSNYGSYHNTEVSALMEQARTMPGCDIGERAEIYREIQRLLQDDPPYAWLMVRHDLVAASTAIRNFAPFPNAPLWNIRDWVVTG